MIVTNCKLCQKQFKATNYGKRVTLYCSKICRNRNIAAGRRLYKYPKYLLDCHHCGKPVYAKNMSFDKPNRKYCNKSCKASHELKGRVMTDKQKQAISLRNTKHGFSMERLHRIWSEMIRRCTNPKASGYRAYGGRGITVADDWKNYLTFREWAMSNGYTETLTIERVDVNGNYCKENCTWIPMSEQAKNRRPVSEWTYKNK